MAIKVKHEGNVTSRIVASAAGGKGRRQAEDAIKLAQLQASATGRGGGGTGGGAHASAAAPTLHAPTGHAQLGSTGGFASPQMSLRERMALEDQRQVNRLEELDATEDNRAAEQWRNAGLTEELHNSDFQRSEVADFFRKWRLKAEDLGVTDWILDPGFGFGKDIAQNWELLVNLRELKALGRPILVGVSMKRMTCASAYVTEKAHLYALEGGADILRVHNVAAARATVRRFHSPSMM